MRPPMHVKVPTKMVESERVNRAALWLFNFADNTVSEMCIHTAPAVGSLPWAACRGQPEDIEPLFGQSRAWVAPPQRR